VTVSAADLSTLSRLLDEAFGLAPEQVEDWLAAPPTTHGHLLTTLREMLSEYRLQAGAGFMADGPRLADPAADESAAHAGDGVGPYRLLREIDRGGMGAVWLAERADGSLKRQVALKLPRLAWGAGLSARMARERDIGALLEHPNIGSLYDAGVDALGRPYLALQYIDGRPLDAWCEAQSLGIPAPGARGGRVVCARRRAAHARPAVRPPVSRSVHGPARGEPEFQGAVEPAGAAARRAAGGLMTLSIGADQVPRAAAENPRMRISASTSTSRPRKRLKASSGGSVLPTLVMHSYKRLAIALS